MKNDELKPAVGYYRCSTSRQEKSGLGLDAQKESVQKFVELNGYKLVAEFTEVESGRRCDRPELLRAFSAALCSGAIVIIARLDRLARSVRFTAALIESNVPFIAVDMPSATRFTIHIHAAIAEEEARLISERVKQGLAQAKIRGVKLGSARDGHWDGREHKRIAGLKKAHEVSAKVRHQKAIKRWESILPLLRDLHEEGLTLSQIGDRLLADGIHPVRSAVWCPSSIKMLLAMAIMPESSAPEKIPGSKFKIQNPNRM
jgi:DNA invertase Pin-like site-specific DNA recombinase